MRVVLATALMVVAVVLVDRGTISLQQLI
jgi:hypothetical protein